MHGRSKAHAVPMPLSMEIRAAWRSSNLLPVAREAVAPVASHTLAGPIRCAGALSLPCIPLILGHAASALVLISSCEHNPVSTIPGLPLASSLALHLRLTQISSSPPQSCITVPAPCRTHLYTTFRTLRTHQPNVRTHTDPNLAFTPTHTPIVRIHSDCSHLVWQHLGCRLLWLRRNRRHWQQRRLVRRAWRVWCVVRRAWGHRLCCSAVHGRQASIRSQSRLGRERVTPRRAEREWHDGRWRWRWRHGR